MKKKTTKKEKITEEVVTIDPIKEITDVFGNGDLNILKDKINEIIKRIN